MLNIIKEVNETTFNVALEGRLDTTTAPDLEKELMSAINGITKLEFDLTKLQYISSAGLRILLMMQKAMNKQGEMTIHGANEEIMEIFDVTGFSNIFKII